MRKSQERSKQCVNRILAAVNDPLPEAVAQMLDTHNTWVSVPSCTF